MFLSFVTRSNDKAKTSPTINRFENYISSRTVHLDVIVHDKALYNVNSNYVKPFWAIYSGTFTFNIVWLLKEPFVLYDGNKV